MLTLARIARRSSIHVRVTLPVPARPARRCLHSAPPLRCGLVAFVTDAPTRSEIIAGDTPPGWIEESIGGYYEFGASRQSAYEIVSPHGAASVTMKDRLKHALEKIVHRGPDHTGAWISRDGRIGLGHTRLSIIDLEATGNQPMRNETGTIHCVANGEIYDFERMRADLQSRGCKFHSTSDSEVALHAYALHGISMVRDLRGEFAITIVDDDQGVVHLIRDRFGIKPLYYARHENRWLVASEMKSLFALGLPVRWNLDNIAGSGQVWNQGPAFAGIKSVPPGCIVSILKNGEIRQTKYWDAEYADRHIEDTRSEAEMIDGVRTRLVESVRHRLRSDVPVGVYLSGGIDSCTALGIASSMSTQPIDAFNISFSSQSRFDEYRTAEAQAKLTGARFHRLEVNEDELAHNLEDSIYHCEQALVNVSCVGKFILSKFVRDAGLKVVLTGEGSDEIFAGYTAFRTDLAKYGVGITEKEREDIIQSLKKGNLWVESDMMLTPDQLSRLEYTFGYVPSWFRSMPPSLLTPFLSREGAEAVGPNRDQVEFMIQQLDGEQTRKMKERWEVVNSSLYLESKTMLPGLLLTAYGDRNEMAHSIEGRLPFLDHHLVEYVNRLPQRVKIKGTREKWILREAARPFITDEVYNRVKHPFLAPPAFTNTKSKLHDLIQSTLRSRDLSRLWWVDQSSVIDDLDRLTEMVKSTDLNSQTGEEREKYLSMLLAADAKFLSIVSYAMLQKRFNVE